MGKIQTVLLRRFLKRKNIKMASKGTIGLERHLQTFYPQGITKKPVLQNI